ncbi:MAG: McrC family protein [Pseudohongiellaceae bacterium]
MTEVITILEHQVLPIVAKRNPGECAITRNEADKLGAIKSLPGNACSWQHNKIKWSQFCGVVCIGGLTLEILPKIHGKENDPRSCRSVLVRMLRASGFMKLHKMGAASLELQKYTVLDIFIQDLCEQLEKELLQGKIRKYITHEENLPVLRGKLLSGYQLRHNLAHKERLYCQFDELSEDIPVNQVIKLALGILVPLARNKFVKNLLVRMLYAFDGVSDIDIKTARNKDIAFNRNEERYASIYGACQQVIQSLYQDVVTGKEQSFSLLFDMNKLFEKWVASILKPMARKSSLSIREQGPQKNLVRRQNIGELFQLQPDISLVENGRVVLIADAKWKLLDGKESKLGIAQSDLYQMRAYASRYGVTRLVLFYPAQAEIEGVYDMEYLDGGSAGSSGNYDNSDNLLLRVITVDIDGGVSKDTGKAGDIAQKVMGLLTPAESQFPV